MKKQENKVWKNWAGNYACTAQTYFAPSTEKELIFAVKEACREEKKIRVHGSGHAFSPIAISNEVLISMQNYKEILDVNKDSYQITCQGGIPLKILYERMQAEGLALPNVGVINKQTLAGAISTGTHGSARKHTSISSAIIEMRLILANGECIVIDKNSKWGYEGKEYTLLDACRISIGLLGVVSTITLQAEPLFYLKSKEYILDFDACLEQFDYLSRQHEYLKVWWFPHTKKVNIFQIDRASNVDKNQKEQLTSYTEAQQIRDRWIDPFTAPMFKASLEDPSMIPAINAYCLETFFTAKTRIGTSFEILVHDETVPMIVSEWALPAKEKRNGELLYLSALKAFRAVLEKENILLHFPVDLRFSAAETAWLSPTNAKDCFYIGICVREYQRKELPKVMESFFNIMQMYGGRPHWGKLFPEDIQFSELYAHWNTFLALKKELDPKNLLTNRSMNTWFEEE